MSEAREAAVATITILDSVILGERHWLPNVTQDPQQVLESIERVEVALNEVKQLLTKNTQPEQARSQDELPDRFRRKGKFK